MSKMLLLSLTAIFTIIACAKKPPKTETPPPPPQVIEEVAESAPEASGPSEAELLARKVQELLNQLLGNKIYFDYDKSELKPEAKEILSQVGSIMQSSDAGKSIQVKIAGHTDASGTEDYNLALGERRAKMVMDYLQSYGIAEARLSILSYGEEQPAKEGDDTKNRRAEFTATTSLK